MSKKRILWLFNHSSLRSFVVPLLVKMGYEVYCPKSFDYEIGDFSCTITYEYDDTLTIPKDVLRKLNQANFYTDVDTGIMDLVNKYFDIVFCMALTPVLDFYITHFSGVVVLHAFGLLGLSSYTSILYAEGCCNLLTKIKHMGSRFWFAPSYDNLAEVEAPLLKNRAVFLPIGLKSTTPKRSWEGGDKRILFVSPKIKTNSYFRQVYEDFRDNFDDLPHLLSGGQPSPVPEDPTVTGFLSNDKYDYVMNHLAAMFYHSQEPRHIHYHPLEAVKVGMPLVFMAGGMLDQLGGKNLPGRCKTIHEARSKLKRLLDGDARLIRQITSTQEVLLEPFKAEFCEPYWIDGLKKIDASVPDRRQLQDKSNKKRIAVILPEAYTGGILDYAKRFTLALDTKIKEHHAAAEIVFAHPRKDVFEDKDYFATLRNANIPIRIFSSEEREQNWVDRALTVAGYQPYHKLPSLYEKVNILHDGMSDFFDCDYAFLMQNRTANALPLFLLCPYTTVAHDYIQRYVPQAVERVTDICQSCVVRDADKVLVTSKPGLEDALQYGGLSKSKVFLTPLLLEVHKRRANIQKAFSLKIDEDISLKPHEYFHWSTNLNSHKNHFVALQALEEYYHINGTLECVITGANTKYLNPDSDTEGVLPAIISYAKKLQNIIQESDVLSEHVHILGELPKNKYYDVLANAAFVFHPGYGDNGNFSVVDAAGMGVPALSSDYPAARYMAQFAGFMQCYTDAFDPKKMAKALMDMQRHYPEYAAALPDFEQLQKADYKHQAEQLYQIVKRIAVFAEVAE